MRARTLGLCLVLIGLIGCKEVVTQDGHVPEKYLPVAKQLAGKFYGNFDGKRAEMEIYFEGDRPLIRYSDARGNDPLDVSCNSEIGYLQSVTFCKKDGRYVLDKATFGFHPGNCRQVEGRNLFLDFSGKDRFTASIVDHKEYTPWCYSSGLYYPYGDPGCTPQEYLHYIYGRFYRFTL
ncbi:MAG: hypothetical protein ACXVB1_17565 [Pseudobdellovibrionaceae bacterium]